MSGRDCDPQGHGGDDRGRACDHVCVRACARDHGHDHDGALNVNHLCVRAYAHLHAFAHGHVCAYVYAHVHCDDCGHDGRHVHDGALRGHDHGYHASCRGSRTRELKSRSHRNWLFA